MSPGDDERRPGGSGVSVGADSTNTISVTLAADLRRRRAASWRCVPLPDGRRDGLDPEPVQQPISEAQLDSWDDALRHLCSAGLAGLLPAEVQAAIRGRAA